MDLNSLKQLIESKKKELVKNERFLTPQIGDTRIVLLPGWNPQRPEVFWREFGGHFIKDSHGKTLGFYPCDDVIFKKPCPVCDALYKASQSTNDQDVLDLIKKARANTQYLVNVIIASDANNQQTSKEPQVMALTKTCFEQLINVIGSWGEKIFDPQNPQLITISRSGTGFETRYMVSIAPNTYPLTPDVLAKIHNLDEYVNQKTDAMMRKALMAISTVTGATPAIAPEATQTLLQAPAQASPVAQGGMAFEDLPTTGAPDPMPVQQTQQRYAPQAPAYQQPMQQPQPNPYGYQPQQVPPQPAQMPPQTPQWAGVQVGGVGNPPPLSAGAPSIGSNIDDLLQTVAG